MHKALATGPLLMCYGMCIPIRVAFGDDHFTQSRALYVYTHCDKCLLVLASCNTHLIKWTRILYIGVKLRLRGDHLIMRKIVPKLHVRNMIYSVQKSRYFWCIQSCTTSMIPHQAEVGVGGGCYKNAVLNYAGEASEDKF